MYIHEYSHGSKDDSACHYDTVLCSSQQRNSVNIHLSVKVNYQLLFAFLYARVRLGVSKGMVMFNSQ